MSISLSMSARQAIAEWFAADQGVVAVESHNSRRFFTWFSHRR